MKLALGLLWWFASTYPMLLLGIAVTVATVVFIAVRPAR